MEPALIVVTLLSLGMAVAMSVIAWRLAREERRRTAARVATLADLAARETREEAAVEPRIPARLRVAASGDPLDRPLRRAAPVAARAPVWDVAVDDDLFVTREPSGTSHRGLVLAVAVVLVVTVVATLLGIGGTRRTSDQGSVAAPLAPLELVSLRHSKNGEALTITGLVQNPGDGRELRNVTVVALVFDQAGSFIASGRAALEFTRLGPGAGSPFSITIANASAVGRYRIGFRTEDGGVLGHVDRRPPPATAAPERARATTQADLAARARAAR